MTVYLYLIEAGIASFEEPITKYIPELAAYATKNAAEPIQDDIDVVGWNDITVGALASQMAGVARDNTPVPSLDEAFVAAGFPPVPGINGSFICDPAQECISRDRAGEPASNGRSVRLSHH